MWKMLLSTLYRPTSLHGTMWWQKEPNGVCSPAVPRQNVFMQNSMWLRSFHFRASLPKTVLFLTKSNIQAWTFQELVRRRTYNKQLNSRFFGCCRVGFLGFDDNLYVLIWQSSLQLFSVLLSLHLAVRPPLLVRRDKEGRAHSHKNGKQIHIWTIFLGTQ